MGVLPFCINHGVSGGCGWCCYRSVSLDLDDSYPRLWVLLHILNSLVSVTMGVRCVKLRPSVCRAVLVFVGVLPLGLLRWWGFRPSVCRDFQTS